jgi:hypothetical protein
VEVEAAWAAHGAEVTSGRQRRREVAGGEFFKIFKYSHFDIRNGDLPDVQTSLNFAGRQIGKHGATSLFVSSSKSLRIASYKF